MAPCIQLACGDTGFDIVANHHQALSCQFACDSHALNVVWGLNAVRHNDSLNEANSMPDVALFLKVVILTPA